MPLSIPNLEPGKQAVDPHFMPCVQLAVCTIDMEVILICVCVCVCVREREREREREKERQRQRDRELAFQVGILIAS
jgi:hypothetical protein